MDFQPQETNRPLKNADPRILNSMTHCGKRQQILGVPFFDGTDAEALVLAREGGLIVAPSGPGLTCDLPNDPFYRAAVTTADLVLPDSGFMVLIWNFLGVANGQAKMKRLSGLKFLRLLFAEHDVRERNATFWVMPSQEESKRNLAWLRSNGFGDIAPDDIYIAPNYRDPSARNEEGELVDESLARAIEARRPRWVFLNVGSGVQEPLGYWLRKRLSYRPSIVCSGAAIAFLTGGQAGIPPWADRFYLGWLLRVGRRPGIFLPRYAKALRLLPMLMRWRDDLPPLRATRAAARRDT